MLLSCKRFSGRHTGQRIAAAFEDELIDMNIKDSIDFSVTDNAANMRAAFSTAFTVEASSPPSLDDVECHVGCDENDDSFQDLICEETCYVLLVQNRSRTHSLVFSLIYIL